MSMTKKKALEIEKKYQEQKQPSDEFKKILIKTISYHRTELKLAERTLEELEND